MPVINILYSFVEEVIQIEENTLQDTSCDIDCVNDIAIWKTDLSATQINTIYNSGQPNDISSIESSSLKRYYKFDRNLTVWIMLHGSFTLPLKGSGDK